MPEFHPAPPLTMAPGADHPRIAFKGAMRGRRLIDHAATRGADGARDVRRASGAGR